MDTRIRKIPTTKGREDRCWSAAQPCRVCGREVDVEKAAHVIEVMGGGYMTTPEELEEHEDEHMHGGAFLGLQPVGPGCARKIPAEYLVD